MDVGINVALRATGGGYRQTGISRYVTELSAALGATAPSGDSLTMLGARLGPACRHAPVRIAWEQSLLAAEVARRRPDVFHGPVNTLPLLMRTPGVVTIHDLAFLRYPDVVPAARRAWLTGAIRYSARAAGRIIAISRQTADDLVAWLGIDAGHIRVVPLAAASAIRRPGSEELRAFRLQHELQRPYVLAVGTLEPRKNLPMVLRAFAAIRDRIPHRLVLVGPEGWLTGELRRTVSDFDLGNRLVLTGFVDDAALAGWYSAADLMVFPSLYEGFGLPMLEAMSCGVPVLASRTPALTELGDDAAVYADPADQRAWSAAMVQLLRDDTARVQLAVAGIARAGAFSWERTARQTWRVYREVAQ